MRTDLYGPVLRASEHLPVPPPPAASPPPVEIREVINKRIISAAAASEEPPPAPAAAQRPSEIFTFRQEALPAIPLTAATPSRHSSLRPLIVGGIGFALGAIAATAAWQMRESEWKRFAQQSAAFGGDLGKQIDTARASETALRKQLAKMQSDAELVSQSKRELAAENKLLLSKLKTMEAMIAALEKKLDEK